MGMAPTKKATTVKELLEEKLKDEKDAVATPRRLLEKIKTEKVKYYDFLLEHDMRHILMEEQEHITELELLLGKSGSNY
jgi:bacterioferritin (cytochrome b1)